MPIRYFPVLLLSLSALIVGSAQNGVRIISQVNLNVVKIGVLSIT